MDVCIELGGCIRVCNKNLFLICLYILVCWKKNINFVINYFFIIIIFFIVKGFVVKNI